MKNKFKFLLISSFIFSGMLISCNNGNNNNSSNSPSVGEISNIEILGPTSVLKGKSINLVSSIDDVIWSSSDETIATVSSSGEVTGISVGVVSIKATYKFDETIYSEVNITVYLNKTDKMSVTISGDGVTKNDDNSFNVIVGKVFDVNVTIDDKYSIPDISYEIKYPSGVSDNNFVTVTPDPDDSRHATVIAYYDVSDLTLVCKGNYNDYASGAIIESVVFNVIDSNSSNYNTVNEFINNYKQVEKDSLLAYSVNQKLKYTNNISNDKSYETNIDSEISHFINSSYVHTNYVKTDSNKNPISNESNNKYQGINIINNNTTYYSFDYDNNGNVVKIYNNEQLTDLNSNNIHYAQNYSNFNIYGVSGLLDYLLNTAENIYGDIVTLKNIYAYGNSDYLIIDNKIKIESNFTDINTGYEYDIKLEINRNNEKIELITYTQNINCKVYDENGNEVGINKYEFIEEYNNFKYGTKQNDSLYASYLNISEYFIDSYDLVELAGTKTDSYNYTDLTKYGANNVSTVNGITKYTLTTDKTLVLKVDVLEDSKASTLIDRVKCSSSDDEQIPSVELTGSDVFAINAKKDDNSISLPGIATFTFTSTLGIEKQIIVEFVKAELKSVFMSNVPSDNDFGKVFVNDYSSHFFINTNPDEDLYSFGIEILDGPTNGIELHKYEDGNIDGLPGYAIKGNIVGTYSFKIYVIENPDIKTEETYTIEIDELYEASYIKDNIVDSNVLYRYHTGTVNYEIKFVSDTLIQYTYEAYGSKVTKNINYHIEKGAIVIDEDQNLGTDAYYSWIKGGNIKFARDFSSITLYLEVYSSTVNEELKDNRYYYPVVFSKYIDKSDFASYVNGKSFKTESFVYGGIGMSSIEVSFSDGNGTLVIKPNNGSSVTFDFKYTYSSNSLKLTSIVSSNNSFSLNSSADVNLNNDTLKFTFTYASQKNTISFNI